MNLANNLQFLGYFSNFLIILPVRLPTALEPRLLQEVGVLSENYHPWDVIQKSVVMTSVIIIHRVRESVQAEKLLLPL